MVYIFWNFIQIYLYLNFLKSSLLTFDFDYLILFNKMALFWNNYIKITRSKNALFRTGYLVSSYAKELTLRFFDHLSKGIL